MNFIYLSPHFPPNYYQFCVHLHGLGVNVCGLADEPYERLRPELRQALTEYYQVNELHSYDELLRGVGYLIHRYGRIDRIDSLNEYWLETEARLRTDFNVPGLKSSDMPRIKRKSKMKQQFAKAGIATARGRVVHTLAQARKLVGETGFPLVAKPDVGVGAAKTYKILDLQELKEFFENKPPIEYILEEFIDGQILSFDGLTDRQGTPVFVTSHQYSQGIMETVNNDDLVYYYSQRVIPAELEAAGMKALKAFNVRERFFHFEFFDRADGGGIMALEVNMRPPGGMTTDMMNYANDIDVYLEWANIIVHDHFSAEYTRPYHCAYIGRKFNRQYARSHEEIVQALENKLLHHEAISGVFSAALGDYGYLVRTPDLEEVHTMAQFIQQLG